MAAEKAADEATEPGRQTGAPTAAEAVNTAPIEQTKKEVVTPDKPAKKTEVLEPAVEAAEQYVCTAEAVNKPDVSPEPDQKLIDTVAKPTVTSSTSEATLAEKETVVKIVEEAKKSEVNDTKVEESGDKMKEEKKDNNEPPLPAKEDIIISKDCAEGERFQRDTPENKTKDENELKEMKPEEVKLETKVVPEVADVVEQVVEVVETDNIRVTEVKPEFAEPVTVEAGLENIPEEEQIAEDDLAAESTEVSDTNNETVEECNTREAVKQTVSITPSSIITYLKNIYICTVHSLTRVLQCRC